MSEKYFDSELIVKLGACLVVMVMVYGLKAYYSEADSENLFWILMPTAFLAEVLSGIPFIHEIGFGWVNLDYQVVIAPACAGVNFMIIAFCMSAFQGICRWQTQLKTGAWVGAAGLSAYGLTIITNALRIWLSVKLYHFDIYSGWLSPEGLHRIAGTGVYYLFLCFYYLAVSFILNSRRPAPMHGKRGGASFEPLLLLVPLFWYLLFALGAPYINSAFKIQPDGFLQHALTVGVTSAGITLILVLAFAGSCCFLKKKE